MKLCRFCVDVENTEEALLDKASSLITEFCLFLILHERDFTRFQHIPTAGSQI